MPVFVSPRSIYWCQMTYFLCRRIFTLPLPLLCKYVINKDAYLKVCLRLFLSIICRRGSYFSPLFLTDISFATVVSLYFHRSIYLEEINVIWYQILSVGNQNTDLRLLLVYMIVYSSNVELFQILVINDPKINI